MFFKLSESVCKLYVENLKKIKISCILCIIIRVFFIIFFGLDEYHALEGKCNLFHCVDSAT